MRVGFLKEFFRTLPQRPPLIASTPLTRVFGITPRMTGWYEKTGVLLFEHPDKTLDRIHRAGLGISGFISLHDECQCQSDEGEHGYHCQTLFFKRVLANMNPDGMRLIGIHNPVKKIHNLMSGVVGDTDEVKVGGTWYTISLARDTVFGVPDAREILIKKNENQDPLYLFTEDEVRKARSRASRMAERLM